MSIANFGIENNTHECQDCGMKFYNSHELVNHMKKFCISSGLNSIQGLAKYQHTSNFSKKLKNYGANSLGTMKYQPSFDPKQLAKEVKQLDRHKQQLTANRPYSNTNGTLNNRNTQRQQRNNQADLGVFENSLVRKVDINQYLNPRAAIGGRVLNASDVSMKSLGNFDQYNNNLQMSKRSLQDSNANKFVSPPTLPSKPFAKNYIPSVLQKSNSSIANMSLSQKKDYASAKLVQLDSIAQMYDKSGGVNVDFRKDLQRMRKFYQKMLENDQPLGKYPGQFAQSRVQTPIHKLRNLQPQPKVKDKKKKVQEDSLDMQLKSNLKNKKSNQQNTQKLGVNPNIPPYPQNYMNYPYPNQNHYYPLQPFNQYPQYPQQPQIIMMPPYPQNQSQNQNNSQISEQIKYFQKIIEMKNEQNKKLMKMLMDTKRQKNQQIVQSKVEQVRKSRISAMKMDKNISETLYHMQMPVDMSPSGQQKILLALQRQELDQLRLLSSLPQQLQQIKMQSVLKLIQQRTQLEKQILQQKVRRLQQQKRNQLHQEQIRLQKDQWANQQRKKLIKHQMGGILQQFSNKINGEESEQQQGQDEQNEQNQQAMNPVDYNYYNGQNQQ